MKTAPAAAPDSAPIPAAESATESATDSASALEQTLMADAPREKNRAAWHARLADIGQQEGFFEPLGPDHSALFVKRGKTLVVTFDDPDDVPAPGDNRLPWVFDYTQSHDWSVLSLMAQDQTWYRDDAVFDFFDRQQSTGFFDPFDRVVFYGASMGAYAACVFSSAVPGATVICISPQATLDRDIAPWETRYKTAWRRNFKSRYGYGPEMIASAQQVFLFYDPTSHLDAMHTALFRNDNVTKLKCRFMGHRIVSLWAAMGVLKPVVEGCVDGSLTTPRFYHLMRARHDTPRYQKEMLVRLRDQKRHALLIRYCRGVLSKRGAPTFRKEMNNALQLLERTT